MKNRNNLKIILLGPIGDLKKAPRGGYQACNRRTLSGVSDHNIKIKSISYPEISANTFIKIPFYIFIYISIIVRLIFLPKCIVHITALYKQFIYIEFFFSLLVKIKGNALIYDIRAGSFINYYQKFSKSYKLFIKLTLKLADKVMIEGKEYEKIVENITESKPFYFPNHVSVPNPTNHNDSRYFDYRNNQIRIVYAGRIDLKKGVNIILEASEKLLERGYDIRAIIAGDGNDKYVNELKSRYSKSNAKWLGNVSLLEVIHLFQQGHFFIFPTFHIGEGQSNALTEAMASGCVPVASDNGFNCSIIGDCGIVLKTGSGANDYANGVEEILINRTWTDFSEKCIDRIKNRFETSSIMNNLTKEYYQIWGNL